MLVQGFNISDSIWAGLRHCQQESIKVALRYIRNPVSRKSSLISLPTGSGKTGVIATLAHVSKKSRVLVLCHRKAVRDQLIVQLKGKFFSSINEDESIQLKEVYDSIDDVAAEGIYVSTFQKLQRLDDSILSTLKDNIDLLIIDEGHSEPSPVWSKLARGLETHRIIITATPYRNDLFQFDVDPESSYVYTFEKALNTKIVEEPVFSMIDSDQLIVTVSGLLKSQPGTKCIVKCKEFSDVEKYFNIFYEKFKVLAVHEKYANDNRVDVKSSVPKDLDHSDYEIIVHQKKLDEGVDIPQAKILILTYPVTSGRELVQTIGRVVRLFKNFRANVIEIDSQSNFRMWKNYRDFDSYLSQNSNKFLSSLDTVGLIDSYLESFPEISYFSSGYKRKFNLKSFDPRQSLIIPLASVCFLKKKDGFTIESMMDRVFWDFTKNGELVELRSHQYGCEILLSITFNNSKFLKDQLFFQPSFEVFLVKDLGEYVAVYDSRSRDFSFETDLLLGASVDVDKLLNLANRSEKSRTKEAHTSAISTAERRPEGISLRGDDLERMVTSQSNSSYALTTLKVDNLTKEDKKESSYYLGVGSGRVSDQKKRNFKLDELSNWIDDVASVLSLALVNKSGLINSYAKPIKEIPVESPVSVLVDLGQLAADIYIKKDGIVSTLSNGFVYFDYKNGVSVLSESPEYKLLLDYDAKNERLQFTGDSNLSYAYDADNLEIEAGDGKLLDLFNTSPIKVLYSNGMSYFAGEFYRVVLPSELGVKVNETKLGGSIISLPCLLMPGLDEKDELNVQSDSFGPNSIFYIIDKLKNISKSNPTLTELGEFYNYIPNVDLMICTDMGTEPADFIISSPDKLVFVHVKCGTAAQKPRSSAGAIAEVGGQAVKNIEMLISHNQNLYPANWSGLHNSWTTPEANGVLQERIRLLNGKRFDNRASDLQLRKNTLAQAWKIIGDRRKSPAVQKEIWIVVGNGFSSSHFSKEMALGKSAQGETLQAYQLIDSWISKCAGADVALKFFVSP